MVAGRALRRHSDHGVTGRLREVSPARSVHLFLPFRVLSLRLSLTRSRSFSRETGWSIRSTRRRLARRQDGAGSSEMFAAPSWFEPRLRGRGPPILPLYHPLLPVQGRFSGELTG